ncbi:peptidoglycan-associated lipoprotein Pal [Hylemonella gracilis]|uniref:Peptidoglycan-associated lipoprotein n=1 Tax=Hylemonella gracilis TaxID=80880 RepID=A0A4P6UJQ8_9BURK|nr:peptidoglycan-associated lipoprotein Pal [Hylemonella gracilis]QBK05382.1 peptidoglycan-associated lipoprotein Pal [Hylemonella gracilis]
MIKLKFLGIALFSLILAACSSVSLDPQAGGDAATGSPSNAPVADGGAVGSVAQISTAPEAVTQTSSATGTSLQAAAMAAGRLVYFDYDSYVIKPEFQKLIEAQARYLASDTALKVVIEGHTDERGGREYNLALGQRRAEAVRRALGLLGVSDAQVEAVSFGEEKPVAEGSNESAWSQNRRAEISYR